MSIILFGEWETKRYSWSNLYLMNLSGSHGSVSYYNINPDELVVVYDDLDLEPGSWVSTPVR